MTRATTKSHDLTASNVHRLVGLLYLITRRDDIVVLGARVRDGTTGTDRDVDIVASGEWGLLGVEVKDEGRPLDVTTVEGLCQKLSDMPALQHRAIVSCSDFTGPARLKAAAHGVLCLRLVTGSLPSEFSGADLSKLQSLTIATARWRKPPAVAAITSNGQELSDVPRRWKLRVPGAPIQRPRTVGEATQKILKRITGPSGPINVDLRVDYPLVLHSGRDAYRVAAFRDPSATPG